MKFFIIFYFFYLVLSAPIDENSQEENSTEENFSEEEGNKNDVEILKSFEHRFSDFYTFQ